MPDLAMPNQTDTDWNGARDPLAILRSGVLFGHQACRGAQAEIVGHVIGGGDAIVLMPTGGRQVGVLSDSRALPPRCRCRRIAADSR